MLSAERIALLRHGAPPRNALEAALRNVWYGGGGASYKKTVGPASIISISDAKPKPAKSLIVGMEPIQDLHGYDSPWPAGGGKNLFDIDNPVFTAANATNLNSYASKVENGFLYNGGVSGESAGSGITIPATEGNYTVSFYANGEAVKFEVRAVTLGDGGLWASNTVVYIDQSSGQTGERSVTVSFPQGYTHLFFAAYSATKYGSWETNVQIEKGSTATAWSPYSNLCPITGRTGVNVYHSGEDTSNPTIYPITWQSEAGTVYGGTVDVVSGLLTVDRAQIASYNGEALPGKWISDRDVYAEGTSPTTGAQVVYELAEPQTYQLTPQQIQMLKGANVLWSDGDSLTLTYLGTTPANLLGGMLGGGLGGAQEPTEETSEEPTEGDGE